MSDHIVERGEGYPARSAVTAPSSGDVAHAVLNTIRQNRTGWDPLPVARIIGEAMDKARAEALREAADEYVLYRVTHFDDGHKSLKMTEAKAWLRARADRLEHGE